ncbi:MAG TPA: hypothetical protein VM432_00515 [Bdellovibrionales bacterium]|nr:hypothetical protein [Bdellovibrionales bacterium]
MIRQFGVLIAITFALGGCMKPVDEVEGGGDGFNSKGKGKVVQKEDACEQGFPVEDIGAGYWEIRYENEGTTLIERYRFKDFNTELTSTCIHKGRSVSVKASVPSAIFPKSREVRLQNSDTESNQDNQGLKCTAALKQGTLYYEFDDACLRIRASNRRDFLTLVPVE